MLASLYLSLTHILLAMHERPALTIAPAAAAADTGMDQAPPLATATKVHYVQGLLDELASTQEYQELADGLGAVYNQFTAVAKFTGSTWEVMIRCENCSTPDEESLHKVPKNGSEVRVFKRHPRQVGHCSALRRNDAMVKAQAAAEARLATGTAIHARTSKLVLHASSRIPARLIRRSTRREAFWGLCH